MIDIQERLTAFAMLGATWVMWLLILLSIIGVAIIDRSLTPVSAICSVRGIGVAVRVST